MAAVVQIQDPATIDVKDVVPDALSHPRRRMVRPILVDQEAVFRFKPEDTIQHVSRLLIQATGFVLAARRGSPYRMVRLAVALAAAFLDGLSEQPAMATA